MIEFSTWSFPSIDANTAALLHIFSPFVVGGLASRLFYGWIDKAGLQSAGFSPTVASFLTTPLLAISYYTLVTKDFIRGSIGNEFYRMGFDLILFGPVLLVLLPLLAIYLRGGFRRKRIFGIILCVAAVTTVILEYLGLGLLLSGS
ncbi:MAG: hypothetical protein V4517_07895 [Pseudomonadota bacterium]